METEIETCNRILAMVSYPECFQNAGKINKPKGLLLHGAPRKGKTFLARAFMKQTLNTKSLGHYYEFTSSDFITKTREEGNEIIRGTFNSIRVEWQVLKNKGMAVIFIDECDQVWKKWNLSTKKTKK